MNSFSVGGVLSRSFSIWRANFVSFFLIAAIVHAPALALDFAHALGVTSLSEVLVTWTSMLLSVLLGLVTTGALAFGVIEQLNGRHASVGTCIATGLRRIWTLIGLSFLLLLIFGGLGIVVVFGGGLVGGLFAFISQLLGVIVIAIVIVVPLAAMYCRLYVAAPAAVVEKAGAVESLTRSGHLTLGLRKRIFAIVFLMSLVMIGGTLLISLGLDEQPLLQAILLALFTTAWGALSSTACAVTYHDLRVIKDGVGAEELAAVFD
jgi:hypothetical protein